MKGACINHQVFGPAIQRYGNNRPPCCIEKQIDAGDLETFNKFITPTLNEDPLLTHGWDGRSDAAAEQGQGQSMNLADLILAKIAEKESGGALTGPQEVVNPVDEDYELSPKVVEVFTKYVA